MYLATRRIFGSAVVLPALVLSLWSCAPSSVDRESERELTIFAAASLRDVVTELGESFVASRSGADDEEDGEEDGEDVELVTNFAGSNVLAQQVVATTGPDVFLSADAEWVDFVAAAGRVVPGTRRELFSNALVLVARPDAGLDLDDVADLPSLPFRHLAVGQPDAVPAGRYARAHLSSVQTRAGDSVWSAVADRVAPALDVRAALALVETDPRIAGIVYRTDAVTSDQVEIVHVLPPRPEVRIRYHGVALAGGGAGELAREFLAWLETDAARTIVERHGFLAGPGFLAGLPSNRGTP